MLLNTWLTAAKRHLFNATSQRGGNRTGRSSAPRVVESEVLENRSLLTALVINNTNLDSFVDASGTLTVTDIGSNDSLVIEQVDLTSTGQGININLQNIALESLAIETVNVTAFDGSAINVTLTNVTGNRTISLEDILIVGAESGEEGINLTLDNTDTTAVTIEDVIAPSIHVVATNGSDITHGVITDSEVTAPANVEALILDVNAGSTANDFHITNNRNLQALNKDAVQINLTDAGGTVTDGLRIANNVIGNEPGADVLFRATGDTFVQPFQLTNNGQDGEQLLQFTLDLRPLGLVFDTGADGQPFTVTNGSNVTQAETSATLTNDDQVLVVDFTDFVPGETLLFVIDVDIAPDPLGGTPIAAPIFGNDLIGAGVQFNFDAGNTGTQDKQVAGVMVGDPEIFNAAFFARGEEASTGLHGINLNLTNSPLSNVEIFENIITGVAGNGLLFDAKDQSDVTGIVFDNTINSSGQDGIRFAMTDSNFDGAVIGNEIGANSGHGINFQPVVSRSGLIEEAFDGNPVTITSTNHGLQTGDIIVIQGMTNQDPSVNHPGNGIHTVTRLGNDTFSLDGVNGLVAGVNYKAGGAWYVPDFEGGVIAGVPQGPARGLVRIDVKAEEPEGRITDIVNPGGGGDVQLTSIQHGLTSGDRVRITGATGTLLDGDYKVTVIDTNTFSLDGANSSGPYDRSEGLARWTTNVITGATDDGVTGSLQITSVAHGLRTGDEVRIEGVGGNTAADGTHRVTVTGPDTFLLQGVVSNGVYVPATGFWTALAEFTEIPGSGTGRNLTQQLADNTITANGRAGIYVNLGTGTAFEGDILRNQLLSNGAVGLHIESHSYGEGSSLPLNPSDPLALPEPQDVSFDVNIGSGVTEISSDPNTISRSNSIPLDGNFIDNNGSAGIAIEALDLATGSFEIQGNKIANTTDDQDNTTPGAGDGIYVALESDLFPVDANSLLVESVIENNLIGVDGQGNAGHGLNFALTQRTRIQDLEVVKNFFGNNGDDGFHFVRTENGSLNAVVFEDNESTNNQGDGFDLYAENSVDDRLDFQIRRNDINNNAEYGVRIDVQAAARIEVAFDTNDVLGNGHTAGGNGFHPDDASGGFGGNSGAAGGVGIFGFEEVEIVFNAVDSRINGNVGDGISIDAFDYRDTVRVDLNLTDVELNSNSLTGFRSHGAVYADFDFVSTQVNSNGEDGVRVVAIEDKTQDARQNVRVAGADISFTSIGGQFNSNGRNGVLLGQAVSAVFGTGSTTSEFTNTFDSNGEDGLKLTQDLGPTLQQLGRRRTVEADGNFFRNNTGDGIDIGHDASLEGGNVEHGYEVASDIDVSINNAVISGNGGDGIEYLADSVHRVLAATGSGQDILTTNISSLHVSNSRIEGNGQRGVDILNRVSEDSRITLTNNEILSNTWSGVYVVNTVSHSQLQSSPNDPLHRELDVSGGFSIDTPEIAVTSGQGFRSPNIELRVQGNNILDNGNQSSRSTVPLQFSTSTNDSSGTANDDWISDFGTVTGTLGGLVVRAGTADTFGTHLPTFTPNNTSLTGNFPGTTAELGLSGVDAEVIDNTFNGNFGASVFLDSFVSVIPPQSLGRFHVVNTPAPDPIWTQGYRDPLSRLDLVFRGNSGNSLDVTNGFAFVDNDEHKFKSRQTTGAITAPQTILHANTDPPGDHLRGVTTLRARNSTRTLGMPTDVVGAFPSVGQLFRIDGTALYLFSYEGYGTPTWRVERGWDVDQFNQTSTTQGFSTFTDSVALPNFGVPFQWDTGVDTSQFTGNTPFSLAQGDIFNVQAGQDFILADGLEENDSFIGATDIGTISGPGFLVNDLAAASLQPNILNIERKGDRDYYSFRTAEAFQSGLPTGLLDIQLSALDATGDDVQFMIYEVTPQTDVEERPMLALDGVPQYRTATAGGAAGTLQVTVRPDTEYIIEVLSAETSNLGDYGNTATTGGTIFVYGTTRSYTLNIDAPVGLPPVKQDNGPGTNSGGGLVSGSSPGFLSPASIPDADPFVDSITDPGSISTSTDSLTVLFSEDVTGVDITDFRLTRDGNAIALPEEAVVTFVDFQTYDVSGLGSVTGEAGTYVFSVAVATSEIIDSDDRPLITGANDSVTWTVDTSIDTLLDTIDNIPGDQIVADGNGDRSLRAAVNEANASPGHDYVQLEAATYTIALDDQFEDAGFSGDFDIHDDLTIRGRGADVTIIDAATLDRVFHVFPGATLTLEDLTIQNGEAFDGGGIFVEGVAVFDATSLTPPVATTPGTVNLTNVNVIDSEAFNQGGGIYNLGTVNAVGSSISRNAAGSRGGGFFNHGDVRAINTTISTNTAVSRGGGLYNERFDSSSVNQTIFPSRASGNFYGLNTTVAYNFAGARGGGLDQEGGGSFTLGNSIVDRNSAVDMVPSDGATDDISGSVNSLGYNFFGFVADPVSALLDGTDVAASETDGVTEAGLLPLAASANGTLLNQLNQTLETPPNAVDVAAFAVDAGSTDLYLTQLELTLADVLDRSATASIFAKDQSGSERLVEGTLDDTLAIDMGAAEWFVNQPVANIVATPNPAGVSETVNLDGTQSTHTLVPGLSLIATFEWDFDYDGITFDVDGTGSTTTTSYNAIGTNTVALRVTDINGAQHVSTVDVVIDAPAPPTIISPTAAGTSDLTPTIAWDAGNGQFALTVTDENGAIVINETGLTEPSFTPTSNLAPGAYTAVVTATNASGSTDSAPYTFNVIRIALTDPLNFDREFDTTPSITFTAIPDAERYQVWVSQLDSEDRSQTIAIVINDSFIDAASAEIAGTGLAVYEPTTQLGEGYYRVWVRAIEANGNFGDWSTGSQFTVERPVITGPASINGLTVDSTPVIEWTDVGANQYQLWVTQLNGTDSIGNTLTSPIVVYNTTVTGTSFQVPIALGNGDFRVWVRPLKDDGEAGLWSAQYNFTKNIGLGPALISPIGGAVTTDRTPVFEWQALEGATHYELWVNNATQSIARVIHDTNVPHVEGAATITYTDPSIVLRNSVYHWWVRAFNEDGESGGWSSRESFFIPSPVLTSPLGVVATTTPTFTWTGVEEYVRYELWVNNLTTGVSRVIYEPNLPGDVLSFTSDLPLENGSFRAWIRAFDVVGNASQWSNPINFTIDANVGNAPRATNTFAGADNSPTFVWEGVSTAVSYEILVKNLLATGQPEVLNEIVTGTPFGANELAYETTTNLASGTFRWWIRGLNTDGSPGPWSQPLDFIVTSADSPQDFTGDADNTVMLTGLASEQWADRLNSITVHPAAVVAAMNPEVQQTVKVVETSEQTAAAAPVDIDNIMEELSEADWWAMDLTEAAAADTESAVEQMVEELATAAPVGGETVDGEQHGSPVSAAALGLMLGGLTRSGRKKKDEEQV